MTANATGMEAKTATATARNTQPPATGTVVTTPRKTPHAPAPAVTPRTIANPANMVFAASVGFMVLPFLLVTLSAIRITSGFFESQILPMKSLKRGRRKKMGDGISYSMVISHRDMVE